MMNMLNKTGGFVCYGIVFLVYMASLNNFFFWDTVQLGSKQAQFYFDHNYTLLLLPDQIDSGHIPGFGMYLAMIWKLFGKSLIVSHLAILPFSIGIVYQLRILAKRFFLRQHWWIAVFLILIDPTLLSQMVLISPDITLVFFFLLGINSILYRKDRWLAVAIFCLFLVSMRGMMVSLALLFFDLVVNYKREKPREQVFSFLIHRGLLYLPAFILFVAFSWYHFNVKGWIGTHPDSPWAGGFTLVDFNGVLRNFGILGWRLLDFGRIGIWVVFLVLLSMKGKRLFQLKHSSRAFLLFFLLLIILTANMLWSANLLGHRYLLPVYISFSLMTSYFLLNSDLNIVARKILVIIWTGVLLTGNFWIYPPTIAQGWDASLAHYPYYKLRTDALNFLDDQDIEIYDVGSFFPNLGTLNEIDLKGGDIAFKEFNASNEFVFYSNIYNVTDREYNQILNDYLLLNKFERRGVFIWICKKKE